MAGPEALVGPTTGPGPAAGDVPCVSEGRGGGGRRVSPPPTAGQRGRSARPVSVIDQGGGLGGGDQSELSREVRHDSGSWLAQTTL